MRVANIFDQTHILVKYKGMTVNQAIRAVERTLRNKIPDHIRELIKQEVGK